MKLSDWHMALPRHTWRHPAVRTGDNLTVGERAADRMRGWAMIRSPEGLTSEIHAQVVEPA